MKKLKKKEKRSAPKKAAINQADRILKKLDRVGGALKRSFEKPDPEPRKKNAYIEKMGKPRYPERIPEDPLGMMKSLKSIQASEPEPKLEVSVRTVYYDGQYLPALCFRKPGALHIPCVSGDPVNGVRKFTIQAAQHDKSPVVHHGYGNFAAPYTPEKFAAHMKSLVSGLRNPPVSVSSEARALLLPYAPDFPAPEQPELPDVALRPDTAAQRTATQPRKATPSGPSRTGGKELIRRLATAAKLDPPKLRAKLRAAGLSAPYTDEAACKKALGLK